MADETKPAKKKATRRKKIAAPRGLAAPEVVGGSAEAIEELAAGVVADGGARLVAARIGLHPLRNHENGERPQDGGGQRRGAGG